MKLSVYPYELQPCIAQLNSQSTKYAKYGCLLRFQEGDEVCYSDFHNDENLLEYSKFDLRQYFQNNDLKQGPQWLQSEKMAKAMLVENKNNIKEVKSHFLIQDVLNFSDLDLLRYETLNYDRFKVKMGRSLKAETNALKKLIEKSDFNTKFRLDFNESIAKKDFIIWLQKNSEWIVKKIDFIEDPIKWDSNQWLHLQDKYGVSFALDMATDPMSFSSDELPHVLVLKPAVQDVESIVGRHKSSTVQFVVTHYMDHVVGQLGASLTAQKLKAQFSERTLTCGLMGFDLFNKNEFSQIKFKDQLSVPAKVFQKPHWGLGFIFNQLSWIEV